MNAYKYAGKFFENKNLHKTGKLVHKIQLKFLKEFSHKIMMEKVEAGNYQLYIPLIIKFDEKYRYYATLVNGIKFNGKQFINPEGFLLILKEHIPDAYDYFTDHKKLKSMDGLILIDFASHFANCNCKSNS